MNLRRSSKQAERIPDELAQRLNELGLFSWQLDLNGMPNEEPSGSSTINLFLCSRSIRMMIVQAAMIWSAIDNPGPVEIHPGLWLFPFIEEHRGRRIGYFVAIGFDEKILESAHIEEACSGDTIHASSLRHVLKESACIHEDTAPRIHQVLKWMLDDLRKVQRDKSTIDLFSEQLADSYEVVTSLQELGRSMSVLLDLPSILRRGIDEIASTLEYNWVACVVNEELHKHHLRDCTYLQSGLTQLADNEVRSVLEFIDQSEPLGSAGSTDIYPILDGQSDLEPQILVHPIFRNNEQIGNIIVGGKNGDDPQLSSHETSLLESIAGMLGACIENADLYHQQHLTFIGTIRALSAAIDAKDQYTQGHSERVAMLSKMLALRIGMSEDDAERIRISGLVHDVGKIGVAEAVLCKPQKLSESEFDQIKTHPGIGHTILKDIPALQDILPGVLHHHERWDGDGYPSGLAGEEIPFMARVMALADTFDAMCSNRAYRSGMPREKVFEEFRRCAGTQFDPELVDPFLELDFSVYDEMVARHKSQAPIRHAA